MDRIVYVAVCANDLIEIFCSEEGYVDRLVAGYTAISMRQTAQRYRPWTEWLPAVVRCTLSEAYGLFPAASNLILEDDLPVFEILKMRHQHGCARVTDLRIYANQTLTCYSSTGSLDRLELFECNQLRAVYGGHCKRLVVEECGLVHTVVCETGCVAVNECVELTSIKTAGSIYADFCPKLQHLPRVLDYSHRCNIWIGPGCESLPVPSLDVCRRAVYWHTDNYDYPANEYYMLFGQRFSHFGPTRRIALPSLIARGTFAFKPANHARMDHDTMLCVRANSAEDWPAFQDALRIYRRRWLADQAHFVRVVTLFVNSGVGLRLPLLPAELLIKIYTLAFPCDLDDRVGWLLSSSKKTSASPSDSARKQSQCMIM
jgi:hypothetical protein